MDDREELDEAFPIERLRLQELLPLPSDAVPHKTIKRHAHFIKLPVGCVEELGPNAPGYVWFVLTWLLYENWKRHREPLPLPNKALEAVGVNRHAKWNALNFLEARGFIEIERRPRKSPIVRLCLDGRDPL